MSEFPPPQRIAFLGDDLPRLCGIAPFMYDLYEAVKIGNCGSLLHASNRILPFAVNRRASNIVSIQLEDLLEALLSDRD